MQAVGQVAAQGVESAKVVVVLIAVTVVAFWRVVLRLLLALIAIAIIVLIGIGVVELLQR
jgi:hypothetical protein